MRLKKIKKILFKGMIFGAAIIGVLVLIAYARTWGKTDLEFRIHINEQIVLQSVYGESPTFAIWLEDPGTRAIQTIFVTGRAGMGDWEGKDEVPVALPKWFEINKIEKQARNQSAHEILALDAITGATPKPGYFTTRVRMKPGSKWICWIEMNLSGDYNEYYKEYDEEGGVVDDYGSGQPALIYKTEIEVIEGKKVTPEAIGMSLLNAEKGKIIRSPEGITTALDIFDEMSITVVKPKPRIIGHL